MKITNEKKMSEWAFEQCVEGNNTDEMRDLITDPFWKFFYLQHWISDKK